MGKDSGIEWTDHTFNPWHGCAQISPGCENCYAKRQSKRSGEEYWGVDTNRRWFGKKHWNDPLKWNKNSPGRVFCGSMCDIFEIHKDPLIHELMVAERIRLWKLIKATPNLEWLLLTKRIDNVDRNTLPLSWRYEWPNNVRLGITVVNQKEADRDIPKLLALDVPNFLSLEPLLGEIDLIGAGAIEYDSVGDGRNATIISFARGKVDWVIVGGESGPNARPMHPDWVGTVAQHCRIADIPFFFKQWGEYVPGKTRGFNDQRIFLENGNSVHFMTHSKTKRQHAWGMGLFSVKVGRKEAGSLLDGKEYKEFPK